MSVRARRSRWIAPAVLAVAATSAFAGQVTLYEGQDFQGRSIEARVQVPALTRSAFDESAGSIVVDSGTWEVCTGAYYEGTCAQLPPGNYPRMQERLNGRILSAREVDDALPPVSLAPPSVLVVPAPSDDFDVAKGRIVLYENPNFSGNRVVVERGIAQDLDWANFVNSSHKATSIRVEAGTWRVCSDIALQGECRILGPGEYPYLSGSLFTGVASAQEVYRPEFGSVTVYRR